MLQFLFCCVGYIYIARIIGIIISITPRSGALIKRKTRTQHHVINTLTLFSFPDTHSDHFTTYTLQGLHDDADCCLSGRQEVSYMADSIDLVVVLNLVSFPT